MALNFFPSRIQGSKKALFLPQNGPRYRSCHLQGQKSLRPLEKSRFCAQGPFRILEMAHLVIFKGCFHKISPHLQHRYINSYYDGNLHSCPAAISRGQIYVLEYEYM